MLAGGRKQRMVAKERQQGAGRKATDSRRGRRPDRAADRHQVIALEPVAEAEGIDQLADRHLIRRGRRFGIGIEAQNVAHHAQELRARQVATLGEERGQVSQPVFHRAVIYGGAERHVGFLHRHAKLVEHAGEMRVVGIVKHDEAGIDRLIAPLARDHGAGMAAQARFGFVNGNVVLRCQLIGSGKAGYAAADDGDALRA